METQVGTETRETITTTMGDLIEAITQVALQATKTQEEAYRLTSITVQDLLIKNRRINPSLKY